MSYDDEHATRRRSLMGLDGFSFAITPLPYEFEEFNLEVSSKKIKEQLENVLTVAGIHILNSEQYAAVKAPGSLAIVVELTKSDAGTYLYAVRAFVTQLAVLERDRGLDSLRLSPVITWMTPQLRYGEVSPKLYVDRIIERMSDVTHDFIKAYKQAEAELNEC